MNSEIVASFQLTPELWFRASRLILQRQHRWLSPRVVWPVVAVLLLALAALDWFRPLPDDLLPLMVLLNILIPLACLALWLTPVLIRRRFQRIYEQFPEQNRQAVWRFTPFSVSAEGGMTRFDGTWDDLHEIVQTPEFFLISRKEKSAGVIPVTAFDEPETLEDFVFLAKSHAPKYAEVGSIP